MDQVEWQSLDSTDIEDKPTFKVVLLGAQSQAEEALYTFKHNLFPEQGVYWGNSKAAESFGWWTFHYLSEDKAVPYTVTYVLQKPEDQYQKLRYVNYPSNVQVLCYACDSPESYAKLHYYHQELLQADPTALTALCALRIDAREGEQAVALKQRGITPISTEQGQARARELKIAHYFEISARTRQGLKEFFEFFQQIADPAGTKRIDSRGELWTVWDKLPPLPPPPVVRVDASNICTELRQSLNSPLVADVVFTLKDRVIYAHKVMLSLAASVFKELSLLAPDSNDHVVNRIYANTLFTKVSEHAFAGSRNNRVSAMVRDDIDHETFLTLLEFIYSGTCTISSIEIANTIQHIIAGSSLFHLQHICKNVAAGNPQANAAIFRLTQQHVIQHLTTLHGKTRKVYSDVVLVLDNKHVTAHRAILAARSGYFRDLFMKNPEQSRVELSDMSTAVFNCLLEFIYTGKCSSLNANIAGELLTAAQLFRTEHVLIQLCESALVKSELRSGLGSIDNSNTRAAAVLQSIRTAQNCKAEQLLEYCAWYVGTHTDEFSEEQLLNLAQSAEFKTRLERHQFPPKNTLVKGVKGRSCVVS